jgi:hypothetical protein
MQRTGPHRTASHRIASHRTAPQLLEFTEFQINVLDMITRDVLFEW